MRRHRLRRRYGRAGKMPWSAVVARREESLTDREIERLQQDAGQAGDMKQVAICERALQGDHAARLACADVIADWEMR